MTAKDKAEAYRALHRGSQKPRTKMLRRYDSNPLAKLTGETMTTMRRNALNDRIDALTEKSIKRLEVGADFEERAADMTVGTKVALALTLAHKAAEAKRDVGPVTNNLNVISVTPRMASTVAWQAMASGVDASIEAGVVEDDDEE